MLPRTSRAILGACSGKLVLAHFDFSTCPSNVEFEIAEVRAQQGGHSWYSITVIHKYQYADSIRKLNSSTWSQDTYQMFDTDQVLREKWGFD